MHVFSYLLLNKTNFKHQAVKLYRYIDNVKKLRDNFFFGKIKSFNKRTKLRNHFVNSILKNNLKHHTLLLRSDSV